VASDESCEAKFVNPFVPSPPDAKESESDASLAGRGPVKSVDVRLRVSAYSAV